jgi:hypothetical protein
MQAHSIKEIKIENYKISNPLKLFFALSSIIGILIIAWAMIKIPERAWPNFLVNFFFFTGLSVFGLIFVAIQHVTNSYWSVTVRRIAESFITFLPVALVLAIILFLGRDHLYEWVHVASQNAHETVHHVITTPEEHEAHLIQLKTPYLNSKFFAVRLFGFLLLWTFLGFALRKNSIEQDSNGDVKYTLKNIKISAYTIPLFGVSFTLFSFDTLMSLQPTWFSTIFGVYCFAGVMFSGLSLLAIVSIYGRRHGVFSDAIFNENHLHDVGKLMFTFIVFWAYIMFSQLMLQWYANLGEEISYYLARFHGGWWKVCVVLFVLHFVFPFLALISRDFKRNENHLNRMAIIMLFAGWLDVYLMVMPVHFKEGPVFGLVEVGTFLGFMGIFAFVVGRALESVNAIPTKDPRLDKCLHHHQ